MMKEQYIEIMDRALDAYDEERIQDYFSEVKETGIKEHGFARLTANMGILIAFGRRQEKLPLFLEMMDYCCEQLPHTKGAGNDFAIRELCFAILRLEEHGTVPQERAEYWKDLLRGFDPYEYYDVIAEAPDKPINNWAAFNAASEYLRMLVCGVDSSEFLDLQIPTQLLSFDENGMYKDPNNPMMYDFVARVQLAVLLHFGYKGKCREAIDENLRKAGELSLLMQSVTGELPFGGRSNQFLHNEAWIACAYEFEANRYAGLGDLKKAGAFKRAANLAAESMLLWLKERPISHVKNRYGIDSRIGCENYAYFNKYMITVASFVYLAYLFADDAILPASANEERRAYAAKTSADFHKVFLRAEDYFLEIDTKADFHYDASGLGRVHKRDCPSAICLSVPFAKEPNYKLERDNARNMSLCSFVETEDGVLYGSEGTYELIETAEGGAACSAAEVAGSAVCTPAECSWVKAVFRCVPGVRVAAEEAEPPASDEEIALKETYVVGANGVEITVDGWNPQASGYRRGFALPVLDFDGAESSQVQAEPGQITVFYRNGFCSYRFQGEIKDGFEYFCNRNGRYRVYRVCTDCVEIRMGTMDEREGGRDGE